MTDEELRRHFAEMRETYAGLSDKSMNAGLSIAAVESLLDRLAIAEAELQAGRKEIERLREALSLAKDALYNGFEPFNQSATWHRVDDALTKESP